MFKRLRTRTLALAGVVALAVPTMGFVATTSAHAADHDGKFQGKAIANVAVRSYPTTAAWHRGTIKKGQKFGDIWCKINAVNVDGNRRWYRIGANGWVSARYVANIGKAPDWCKEATFKVAKATKKPSVNLRQGPTNRSKIVGSLKFGTKAQIICKVNGPKVGGNPRWYQLLDGRWVTARYMQNVGYAPMLCGEHTS